MVTSLARWLPLALLLVAGPVLAGDWPGWRRDVRRTAAATGSSNIHKPAPRWRAYLGGSLSDTRVLAVDVNADGYRDILYIAGGKLIAKQADDTLIWETSLLRLDQLRGLFDLDGDGTKEVVAGGEGGFAYVFEAKSGTLLWQSPDGAHTLLGALLVSDLDGDGTLDLYVAEKACGTSNTVLYQSEAYSFASGYKAPKKLWTIAYLDDRTYPCGVYDVIADLDGDKVPEIVALDNDTVHLYDGKTGKHKYPATNIGSIPFATALMSVVDVDGQDPPELCLFNNPSFAASINSRRVVVMGWDSQKKQLITKWQHAAPDVTQDRHTYIEDAVVDLDGDKRAELVTSFYSASSALWTTYVFDAAATKEVVLDSITGEFVAGVADVDADGKSEVLTITADGKELRIRRFAKGKLASTVQSIKDAAPVGYLDRDRWSRQAARQRTVVMDSDADGKVELLVRVTSGSAEELQAYSLSGTTPQKKAAYLSDPDVALQAFLPSSDVGVKGTVLLVPRSDGYLVVLGSGLVATNEQIYDEFKKKGMRIGGFNAAYPVVADLDGDGKKDLLVVDSRGKVLRLDPQGANLVKPPKIKWEADCENSPATADLDGDGKLEVLVGEGGQVKVYTEAGKPLWSRAVNGDVLGSLIWGDVSGDGKTDVIYTAYNKTGGTELVNALDGKTGAPLWKTDYSLVSSGCGFGFHALMDLDKDSVLDVLVTPAGQLVALSGKDGKELAKTPNSACTRGYPFVWDIDADGALETVATGAAKGMRAFRPEWSGSALTLKTLWTADPTLFHAAVFAAPTNCSGLGTRLSGPYKDSASLVIRRGDTGANVATLVLAGGSAYASESAAKAAGKRLGSLTSAVAHADLAGDGKPAVLVGSDDGYLYAVDPCGGKLVFATNLRAPVGEPILADLTGDGKDEIVLASEDGFLYALGREDLPAPATVYENAGKGIAKSATEDVDQLETATTLYANWSAVAGADAYEYAIITSYGAFITSPEFVSVGNVTQVTATSLKIQLGQRYTFAVRALNTTTGKTSGETLSDGVLIVDQAGPTINLVANPNPFDPRREAGCGIQATFTDGHKLASYRVWIEDAQQKTIRDFGKQTVQSYTAAPVLSWDGKDSAGMLLAYGTYQVKAEAEDLAKHKTTASLSLLLKEKPYPDGFMGGDGALPLDGSDDGCGCAASGAGSEGTWLLLLVGLALLARKRRR